MQRKGDYMAKLPAGTRKRENGTFEKRFTVNGKRYSIYATNTKELAEKEQVLREEIKRGCYTRNAHLTLDQYFEEWIKSKKQTTKANTINLYSCLYNNHIRQYLGARKIREIETREIINMRDKLINGLSITSVNHIVLVLIMILNNAVKDRIIMDNPAGGIKKIQNERNASDTIHRALTITEQDAFLDALKDNYYYTFIALMLATGMRFGEVAALTWEDIDTKNNVIHITKTQTKDENGSIVTGSPKSKAGKRDIPLNDDIKKLLTDYKKKMCYIPFATNNIFSTPLGYEVRSFTINNAIRETVLIVNALGKVHIDPITSHAMRDTFATRYIERGGNMQALKKLLGHKHITMTMDLYAHVLPDTLQDEMDRIKII